MTLRDQLTRPRLFDSPALPALNSLIAAKERILSRWPDVAPDPPEKDRDRLVAEMRDRLARDRWDGAYLSFVTAAARAAFDEDRRERPDLAGLRAFYADEIRASTSRTFLSAMASVYIGSYVPGAPHTKALAAALQDVRGKVGLPWRDLFERVPACLSPLGAHRAIAEIMTSMVDPFKDLKSIGLRSPHAPGLMDHAHLAYVDMLERELKQRAGLDRLLGWLKPEGQSPRVSGSAEAINAILGHWRTVAPSADDLSHITQSLIGFYGDPRVQRGGAWAGVAPDRLAVILRWLTGENIRFFLDVVSAVEDSHMWEPRRRFWLKLHEQGRIDGAWVAFSNGAAQYARRHATAQGGRSMLNFGYQTAGGGRANTSLLVLKIGNKIVIEGSHNYKVHIFQEQEARAPQLYQREYDCERIRRVAGANAKTHNGDWQGWVLERI